MLNTFSSVNVLLIEEDSYYRWQIGKFLHGIKDCSVLVSESLGDASNNIATNLPDVILLAEGCSGEKTLEWFRSMISERHFDCIIVSLDRQNEFIRQAYLSKGAWDCLAKSNENYFTDFCTSLKKAVIQILDRKLRVVATSDGEPADSQDSSEGEDQAWHHLPRSWKVKLAQIVNHSGSNLKCLEMLAARRGELELRSPRDVGGTNRSSRENSI